MELRVLKNFLVVAREGNITAAANKLHITQPALSRQMASLQTELGVSLFTRTSHSVNLTPEGHVLRERASELIDHADKVQLEVASLASLDPGDVYFGAAETPIMQHISAIAETLREEGEEICLNVTSGNAIELAAKLDRGLLDFALLSQPANSGKYACLDLPWSEQWALIARRDHPLAARSFVTPEDLANEPLIMSQQMTLTRMLGKNVLADWFGPLFSSLAVTGTFNLAYNGGMMVRAGLGSAITWDGLIAPSSDGELVAVPLRPKIASHLTVVWRKGFELSRSAKAFRDALISHIEAHK